MAAKLVSALSLVLVATAWPQETGQTPGPEQAQTIRLTLPAGMPLRLYLTKRVSKRLNAPVEAKLLTPLYAFDREVIPSGTQVLGRVSRIQPVPRGERIRAVLAGDFSPLHVAQIEFTSLVLPNGRTMALHTIETPGLKTLVPLKPPKQRSQKAPVNNGGVLGASKQQVRDQIDAQIARIKGIPDLVRETDRKEWLYDFAMSKLPYHPQSVHNRTRFDADLRDPLDLGSETVTQTSLALLGSQPAPGSIAHARLLTSLDSLRSKPGERVAAVLEQPLFSNDHRLIFPEGTLVSGTVAIAKRAGWFHRGGRLRFSFQNVDLTPSVAALTATPALTTAQEQPAPQGKNLHFETQATLHAAEGGNAPLKVDPEGGVQATESKTRFIGTAVAVLIASKASDNDAGREHNGAVNGESSNVGGRTLGGGLGFGLLGSIAAQSSRYVGTAFGYYGLAWSVYSTVVARGSEVQFPRNAVIDIAFNQRVSEKRTKLQSGHPNSSK